MFDSPRRNHFTIVFERAGAVIAALLFFGMRSLEDYGWEIFRLSFYRELLYNALHGGAKTNIFALIGAAGLLWYLYISVRYWRLTTFCIASADPQYRRRQRRTQYL